MNPSEHDAVARRRTVDASNRSYASRASHTSHTSHTVDASNRSHVSSARPRSSSASPTPSPRRRLVSDGPSRIQVRATTGVGAPAGNAGMNANAANAMNATNANRNPFGYTNHSNPPGSPSAFSQHSIPLSPLSHQSSMNPTMAADLKKWVQNEEHLVPNYDVDDDEHHILEKLGEGENALWDELFPDDDRFMSELEQEESRREQERAEGWREWLCSKSRWRFLRSRAFVSWAVISAVQIVAVTLGICNLVYGPYSLVWEFQTWRVCFLVALLPFTWIFGDFFVWLVIKFVERFLFTFPNCLYFTYACKGPLRWVMRFLALTILWACMMTINTDLQLQKVNEVYDIILKVIGCITLFFTANLFKRLAAKSLALNLNKGKNQLKLEAALRKEKILRILLGPRKKATHSFLKATLGAMGNVRAVTMRKSVSTAGLGSKSGRVGRSMGDIELSEAHEVPIVLDIGNPGSCGSDPPSEAGDVSDDDRAPASPASPASPTSPTSPIAERLEKAEQKRERERQRKLEKQKELQRRKNVILRLNLLETYIRNHQIKVAFKDELNTESIEKIQSEGEAKRIGSFLYWNVKGELTGFIVREDLDDFFLDNGEEKDLAFSMLDISGDGQVDLKECIQAVDGVFVDRRNLAATLKDGKNITKTLETLIGIVIHTIFIFFYLLVWEANVGSIWVSFSGIILGFSFIFSRTVSEIFDNVVFLFGTHAYSVGDLLLVQDTQMVVEEVSLNFTQLRNVEGRTVWMPNQCLCRNAFTNLTTSTNFFGSFVVYVDWSTVMGKPDLLDKIVARLEAVREANRGEYGTVLRACYDGYRDPYKIGIKVVYEYGHSGADLGRTATARGRMAAAVGEVLVEEGVEYSERLVGRGGERLL